MKSPPDRGLAGEGMIFISGLVAGLGIRFYAMIKYNKEYSDGYR